MTTRAMDQYGKTRRNIDDRITIMSFGSSTGLLQYTNDFLHRIRSSYILINYMT